MKNVPPQIFCKTTLKLHRQRHWRSLKTQDPLILSIEANLFSRILDFKTHFKNILALGFRSSLEKDLRRSLPEKWLMASPLARFHSSNVVFDEEFIPFAPHQFDLILIIKLT